MLRRLAAARHDKLSLDGATDTTLCSYSAVRYSISYTPPRIVPEVESHHASSGGASRLCWPSANSRGQPQPQISPSPAISAMGVIATF